MIKRAVFVFCLGIALSTIVMAQAQRQTLPSTQEPSPLRATSASDAKQMFTTYCATCHGKEGRGDGPAAKSLKKAPADLTKISARNGGTFPLIKVRQYIEGIDEVPAHGSRDMPIWGSLFIGLDKDPGLKELRVTNLADYLKSIQK